jgi:hypothetical protein
MLNMVQIYHIRDAYDHSRGYGHNNTYTNANDEVIKELIAKQERYVKNNDIGGYWIQVTSYEVGQPPTVVDHIKTVPQKTRIELNVKARRDGKPKKSLDEVMNVLHANMQAGEGVLAAPIINNLWANAVHVAAAPQQEEWL